MVDNHEFLLALKGQPPVTQHFCFAVDGQQRGNDVLYRFHSCCCTSCMTDLGECRHLDFVGAWNTKTVTFHPILSHPDWRDFERQIRADLLQHTATLLQPILCLGVRRGLQYPEVILVPPLARVSPRSIQCYVLDHVGFETNDFGHTKVFVPPSNLLCKKMYAMCQRRVSCQGHGKKHLVSFPFKNIMAIGLYRTGQGKPMKCAFQCDSETGLYELKDSTTSVLDQYNSNRAKYFNDFETL